MDQETKTTAKRIKGVRPKGPKLSVARGVHVPANADPRAELRLLVQQHKALIKSAIAVEHMCTEKRMARRDIVDRATGEVRFAAGDPMPSLLPSEVASDGRAFAKEVFRASASKLESAMRAELKKIPIFSVYLSKLFGCSAGGPIPAYLVAEIDIRRAEKPSALRRFCGLAVINGRLERRTKGEIARFSTEMRTRLYQLFDSMWKNQRHAPDNKYLKIWRDAKHRIEQSERVTDRGVDKTGAWTGKLVNGAGKTVSARGFAHSYGWHKAADVFLEDLYVVWRAIEGLPVWPSYYAAKLTPGYEHGGKISVNAPRMLTVDEALALVGATDAQPVEIVPDVDVDADLEAAAEE